MVKLSKKLGAVLIALGCSLLLCIGCMCTSAGAADGGTLTLVCEYKTEPVKSMMWNLFRVGSYVDGNVVLEGDFAQYHVDFGDMSAKTLTDAATTLRDYAFAHKLKAAGKKATDRTGTVVFEGLEDGVYLAAAKAFKTGSITYKGVPAFFVIDQGVNREVKGFPKFTQLNTLAGEWQRFTIRKEWLNTDGMPVKPTKITAEIYCDYELYDTVELTEENGWVYNWEANTDSEWTIIEKSLPDDCTVVYRNDGRRYIVANTYNPNWVGGGVVTRPPVVTTTKPKGVLDDDETVTTAVTKDTINTEEKKTTASTKASDIVSGSAPDVDVTETATNSVTTVNNGGEGGTSSTKTGVAGDDVTTSVEGGGNVTTKKPEGGGNQSSNGGGGGNKTPSYHTTTTQSKLPQTGQLWWPVPAMAISGFVLIAFGARIVSGSKRDEDE